jgi:hypothetical protein
MRKNGLMWIIFFFVVLFILIFSYNIFSSVEEGMTNNYMDSVDIIYWIN